MWGEGGPFLATDVGEIARRLASFYDFAAKTVIDVGAGGGQLVEYARPAARVMAVDRDLAALERLGVRLRELRLSEKCELIADDLLEVRAQGDVVLLEFCLHEMAAPDVALAHARKLAPDVVVIDHAPGSPWAWYAAEDGGVEAAWNAVARERVRRQEDVQALQLFADYAELEVKLSANLQVSRDRIHAHRGEQAISIPMPYRLALL